MLVVPATVANWFEIGLAYLLAALLVRLACQLSLNERSRVQRERLRTGCASAALATLALWWPPHWLAPSGRTMAIELLCVAVSMGVAVSLLLSAPRLVSVLPVWLPQRELILAAVATGVCALMFTPLAGWSGPAEPDWLQVGFVALLLATAWVLRDVLARSAPLPRRSPDLARGGSRTDPLTGLETRQIFESRLGARMAKKNSKRRLAILFIDLDGFKPVNDTYGHSVGDEVLKLVGKRLEKVARQGDCVARVGGDEFLMMIGEVKSDAMAGLVAKRIIDSLRQNFVLERHEISISCSIGIAFYPGAESLAKLVGQADAAMYAVKRAGGSDFSFYTSVMEVDAEQGMELARDLRRGLANNEFELHYQPKIDVRTNKVTAAEALLRWRHPERGEVSPSIFIPIAERSGLMTELSNWVIEDACRQGRAWRESGLRMRVAINISPQQMRRDDLVEQIANSLRKYRIHPSLLTCEITESLAMEDTRTTQETFRRLGELGTHLSIDDFGTGYSSLSYLRRLPASELKIDSSFVVDLQTSADARAIVKAIVNLAHALGLKVVAEGVENVHQQEILTQLGCDELQGFLFAKPMSARALLIWALSDRTGDSEKFKASLFGETRQVQRPSQLTH